MSAPHVLIAGVGNIFLGDDAFGVEVARRLNGRPLPAGVSVVDFGIRGFDLVYALLEGPRTVILVDATPRGGQPGTLYTIEPDLSWLGAGDGTVLATEAHGMDPLKVFRLVKSMGGELNRVFVVGCEPATTGEDLGGLMGLSPTVEAAVDGAVDLIESLLADFGKSERNGARYNASQQ
jgi:hydrogenase maturation protease